MTDEPRIDADARSARAPAASLARRLADWAVALRPADIPERQRRLAGLRAIDTLGLVLAGCRTPAAAAVYGLAATDGGRAEATLVGTRTRVSAVMAALAHGTAAHCRDFDDTFPDSVVHPGSVVVPVALALGEARDAALDRVGAAIVVGYEVAARLGAAAGRGFHARGFHATSVVGPLAAAAVAARFLGLDGERLASAFGLAGSMSGGLLEFAAEGTWSKWLHPGWAAQGGITAAALAARGFRGPGTVLEGRFGLYRSFLGGEMPVAALADGLGTRWKGEGALFKHYPCAHVVQPYVDAALALAAAHGIAAAEVASVRCGIAEWAVPIVCEPRARKIAPANDMEAIASLPYQLAAALVDGRVDLDTLSPRRLARVPVQALAARVTHVVDPALGHGFDGTLEIALADGTVHRARAASAPPDPARVIAKFRANAGEVLSGAALARIEALAEPLWEGGVRELLGVLR